MACMDYKLGWQGVPVQWPWTLTYIFKVPQPNLCNKTTKIWHTFLCLLYTKYSSRWILSIFGKSDHWPLTLSYTFKVIQSFLTWNDRDAIWRDAMGNDRAAGVFSEHRHSSSFSFIRFSNPSQNSLHWTVYLSALDIIHHSKHVFCLCHHGWNYIICYFKSIWICMTMSNLTVHSKASLVFTLSLMSNNIYTIKCPLLLCLIKSYPCFNNITGVMSLIKGLWYCYDC